MKEVSDTIFVQHVRYPGRIHVTAFRNGSLIEQVTVKPMSARALGKFKMTFKNALQLRYQT